MVHALAAIQFPHIDPVAIKIGPLSVRWYGLAYLSGFIAGYFVLGQMIKNRSLQINSKQLGDVATAMAIGVVLGGRLGWWIFYHRDMGRPEPWYEPIAMWHGGMSFHGGLIGVVTALLFWSWQNKAPFWNLADAMALVTPIGLFAGRIANFINAELVGRPTTVPWGVIFPGDTVARHPSQLYEAILEGPVIFLILWLVRRYFRQFDGKTAATFVIAYGMVRFLVEFTREPDKQLGFIGFNWLTMGQLLSLIMTTIGVMLLIMLRRSGLHDAPTNNVTR